ncbi:MAG: hypothetical protein SVK08_01055 [Halobacteriota archaeon]|nr:hypothetical protein [Halobacteriota archaeon]
MKLEIYKGKEEKEEVTKIRLMYNEEGIMCIMAVDDDGKPLKGGKIASILPNGTFLLWGECRSKTEAVNRQKMRGQK